MVARAKFTVQRIERSMSSVPAGRDGDGRLQWDIREVNAVVMSPVTSGSAENEAFFASTPNGEIKIGLIDPATVSLFELGKAYYVDFTPAG